jgi:hypothetical protein
LRFHWQDSRRRGGTQRVLRQFFACCFQGVFELLIRPGNVNNRQMKTFHATTLCLIAEMWDPVKPKLLRRKQCDHSRDASVADRIEIESKVAVPTSGLRVGINFAQTEGHPYPPPFASCARLLKRAE